MHTFKNNLDQIKFINYLICLFPLTFILGNFFINLNIILICISGYYFLGRNIFSLNNKVIQFLIYFFFIYLILITLTNNLQFYLENNAFGEHILKSIYYLRFLIFFLVISKFVEKKYFNIKIFFFSAAIFSTVISFDILIQFFSGKNLIGYPITLNRPSSFFNTENIAGGYLQRFILFLIFLIYLKKKKTNNSFLVFLFLIFLIPITLTANRMPTVIYISSIFFYFLIEKKFKEIIIFFLILFSLIFFLNKKFPNHKLNNDFKSFSIETLNIISIAPKLFYHNNDDEIDKVKNKYLLIFNTGIQLWKEKKIFGHGIKAYRIKCESINKNFCTTHPHNFLIEILIDVGLVGLVSIFSIFVIGAINFFNFYYKVKNINLRLITSIFFLLVFFEFFPIRSTGSFFSTTNSAYIFLMLAIFINLKKLLLKENMKLKIKL